MCTVCGCGEQATSPPLTLDFGKGPAGAHLPGVSESRTLTLEKNILGANEAIAQANRAHFKAHQIRALNLLSSPGSGKTTLLCRTLEELQKADPGLSLSVIEGDQQTRMDADRIAETGVEVVQVNTGKGCHLDAQMVANAFTHLHHHHHDAASALSAPKAEVKPLGLLSECAFTPKTSRQILFVENVGNLVCPALWDLGESAKIVILSVTEGEDKPLKYPDMFQVADLLLINKIDLLPHVDFDTNLAIANARKIKPGLNALSLSSLTGEGFPQWIDWLLERETTATEGRADRMAIEKRIEALEAELRKAQSALIALG